MQCFKCLNEWEDSKDMITGICPFCNTNLLKSLTNESQFIRPEIRLQYVVQFFGNDVLRENTVITGIILDLFSNDLNLENLILKSIKYKIPDKLIEMEHAPELDFDYELMILVLIQYLIDKTSINYMEAAKVIFYWQFGFGFRISENLLSDSNDYDPLFKDVVKFVFSLQRSSTVLIQRRFKIGYNRADQISKELEITGIIGPFDGSKFRQVLVKNLTELKMILDNI